MSNFESLILDGLQLNDTDPWVLEQMVFPPAAKRYDRVSSADADGSALVRAPRYDDAEVTLRLRLSQQSTMDAALIAIGGLVDKLQEADRLAAGNGRGMELVWTPSDSTYSKTLYVKGGEVVERPQVASGEDAGWLVRAPVVVVKLTCHPFMYGEEVTGTPVTASTPVVEVVVPDVAGDVDAEARLIVTDAASKDRWFCEWGLEQRNYNPSTALLLDSDSLVTSGFAGSGTTRSGAYDPGASGNSVIRATLVPTPVAVCGTGDQAHVGVFRIRARVWASASGVTLRFAWRVGDGPLRSNSFLVRPAAGAFCEVDLGTVSIPAAALGNQRWQGQIEAYSDAAADTLDVDYIALIPASEGYGKARRAPRFETPTSFSARDEFDQSAGALTGKTAPVGGTWAGAGDATGFTVDTTSHLVTRIEELDANAQSGRYAVSGVSAFAAQVVQVDVRVSGSGLSGLRLGVLARYADTSNWLSAFFWEGATGKFVTLEKRVAGTVTEVKNAAKASDGAYFLPADAWYTIRLYVDAAGRYRVWAWPTDGEPGGPVLEGADSDLATGGALASGKPGFYDANPVTPSVARWYDNFAAWVPANDAVIFSGQSLEFRSADTLREDSTGTYWGVPPSYRGSRFWLPPEGDGDRDTRIAVIARRNDLDTTSEANVTDSTTVQVNHAPRFLVAPRS